MWIYILKINNKFLKYKEMMINKIRKRNNNNKICNKRINNNNNSKAKVEQC